MKIVKGIVASASFALYPNKQWLEINFIAKVNGRFEAVRFQGNAIPKIGREVELIHTDDTYPLDTEKGEPPVARLTYFSEGELLDLKIKYKL